MKEQIDEEWTVNDGERIKRLGKCVSVRVFLMINSKLLSKAKESSSLVFKFQPQTLTRIETMNIRLPGLGLFAYEVCVW